MPVPAVQCPPLAVPAMAWEGYLFGTSGVNPTPERRIPPWVTCDRPGIGVRSAHQHLTTLQDHPCIAPNVARRGMAASAVAAVPPSSPSTVPPAPPKTHRAADSAVVAVLPSREPPKTPPRQAPASPRTVAPHGIWPVPSWWFFSRWVDGAFFPTEMPPERLPQASRLPSRALWARPPTSTLPP